MDLSDAANLGQKDRTGWPVGYPFHNEFNSVFLQAMAKFARSYLVWFGTLSPNPQSLIGQ